MVLTLTPDLPLSSGAHVVPGSLNGSLDHDRSTRGETAYPEDGLETDKPVAEGGDEDEIEEFNITVDGLAVPGVASGSPVESVQLDPDWRAKWDTLTSSSHCEYSKEEKIGPRLASGSASQ